METGKIFVKLNALELSYLKDERLSELFVKASVKKITGEEVREIKQIIKKLDLQSSLFGMALNALLLNLSVTEEDVRELSEFSSNRIEAVVENGISELEQKTIQPVFLQSVMVKSFARQTKGQLFLAEKKNLKSKTFVRTGSSKEPRLHSKLEGTTIPYDSLFKLPDGSSVVSAHDWQRAKNPQKEWINCRHSILVHPFSTTEEFREFVKRKKV